MLLTILIKILTLTVLLNLKSVRGFPPLKKRIILPQFYIVGNFSGGFSQTDHKFNFNTNVNATVDSYINRSFNFSFSQFYLIAVPVLLKGIIRRALRCNIVSSEDILKLNNLCNLIRTF